MNLKAFGLPISKRKTLIILGAGASRGASFVSDESQVLPPLDRDFFQQLSRLRQTKEANRLLRFVRTEYGHEIGLSMEQFFSEADYTNRFHQDLNVDRGPTVKRYQKALNDFMKSLPILLERTTARNCLFHEALASRLHAQDCVISFNYDCLIDRALREEANRKWDPDDGSYGFTISGGGSHWKKHSRGRPVKLPIRLLKMHGSANWLRNVDSENEDPEVELAESTNKVKDLSSSIIPPTWFKDLQLFPFGEIWKAARKEVRTARAIIVIGYSVPETDLFTRSLFKVEAGSKEKREQLDLLVLVNPRQEPRRRFLDLVGGGVEPTTKILEYHTLVDLVNVVKRAGRDQ